MTKRGDEYMKRHLGKWLAPSQGFYSAVGPRVDPPETVPKNPGSGSNPTHSKEPEVTVTDDRKLFLNEATGELQVAQNPVDRYFFENAGWSQVSLDDLSGRRLATQEES